MVSTIKCLLQVLNSNKQTMALRFDRLCQQCVCSCIYFHAFVHITVHQTLQSAAFCLPVYSFTAGSNRLQTLRPLQWLNRVAARMSFFFHSPEYPAPFLETCSGGAYACRNPSIGQSYFCPTQTECIKHATKLFNTPYSNCNNKVKLSISTASKRNTDVRFGTSQPMVHASTRTHTHVHTQTHACMCTHTHTRTRMPAHTHTHTHTEHLCLCDPWD